MRRRQPAIFSAVLGAIASLAFAATASAQTGRVGGIVKDDRGDAIKGATVTAENPNTSPSSFTATTDDKGRFAMIGLRAGAWMFTAQAPGFGPVQFAMQVSTVGPPNPPMTFTLRKAVAPAPPSALGNIAPKDLQSDLAAADADFNANRFDESIVKYRAILSKAPALTAINLQIAQACVNKKDYAGAMSAYADVLKDEPANEKAIVGAARVNMQRGDLTAAADTLQKAAAGPVPTRDVFYALGEVEQARGRMDGAAQAFQKAADIDPSWGKPIFRLAVVARDKGDRDGAVRMMEKVIAVDPTSPEAAEAKTALSQLKQ
jgi:TolA-binding protein